MVLLLLAPLTTYIFHSMRFLFLPHPFSQNAPPLPCECLHKFAWPRWTVWTQVKSRCVRVLQAIYRYLSREWKNTFEILNARKKCENGNYKFKWPRPVRLRWHSNSGEAFFSQCKRIGPGDEMAKRAPNNNWEDEWKWPGMTQREILIVIFPRARLRSRTATHTDSLGIHNGVCYVGRVCGLATSSVRIFISHFLFSQRETIFISFNEITFMAN